MRKSGKGSFMTYAIVIAVAAGLYLAYKNNYGGVFRDNDNFMDAGEIGKWVGIAVAIIVVLVLFFFFGQSIIDAIFGGYSSY